MKFKRLSGGTLGLVAVGALVWGCSDKGSDCSANLSCAPYSASGASNAGASGVGGHAGQGGGGAGSSGTSGQSGSSGTSGASGAVDDGGAAGVGGGGPPACDGTLSPDADACVISDDYGLFVSATGDDTSADGSAAKPFATLTKALSSVDTLKRIYVCAGEYAEPDTLVIPDHVSIYGGFSCDGGAWKYDSPIKAHLMPASAIGATITSAKNGVTLQDVRLDAANAADNGTGANSFGLMITDSVGVVLTRVEVHAGKGGGGKPGVDGATGADGVTSGAAQNGTKATCTSAPNKVDGARALAPICVSQGGDGGSAFIGTATSPQESGGSGFPAGLTNNGAGAATVGDNGGVGLTGSDGTIGAVGQTAATVGVFTASGYSVASGGNGTPGKPGQGGGGGGASLGTTSCVGATGGAGGMGGCGGDPGTGGGGGGASVALLSWQSTVSIDACSLIASNGGAGANGGKAHAGGAGSAGGAGGANDKDNIVRKGGPGGDGGTGGNGGNGAGGTGGPSIALVYGGTAPEQKNGSVLTPGVGGAAGIGGQLGASGNWGADGSKGLAQDYYPKP